MSKRWDVIFSVVCWSVFLYTYSSLYSKLSLFILMFQKWLKNSLFMSHLLFLDFPFWQQDGHFDLLCSCFFLYYFIIRKETAKDWQQYPKDGYWIFQFNGADLLFVRDVQQGILPADIDSRACKLNIYPWSEHIAPTSCYSVQTWSSLIFVCSIPWKLQVCCTYCQWLSSRSRHTFSMRLSIKQLYPF